ncbi:DUF3788 domain-containing protein [Oscillospiraceae bacterium MB08-C2-2]|nr:DUF3788 domain-containing protein [Oscillospiraceae bacterium MB08-C2-2]
MKWTEQFAKDSQPTPEQIGDYIASSSWEELRDHLEITYNVEPKIDYSICSGAPGWNVKYRKSSRALCTLYPAEGYFTCLVSIGSKEAMEAELLLGNCTEYVRELYWSCKPFNGSRWLMIDVTSPEILEDVKALISLRVKGKKAAKGG